LKNPSQWKWGRPLVILVWVLLLNLFLVQKFIGSQWKSVTITLAWLGCALITWQLMALWSEKWRARYPDIAQTRQRILGTFSGYLVIEALSQAFFFLLMYFARWDWEVFTLKEYSIYITLCVVTLFAVGAIYELIYSLSQYGIALQEEEAIKKQSLQNQFDSLKNQVNPHFLFNSLHTLKYMVESQDAHSVDFILKLSRFYRFTLEKRKLDVIRLSEELDILRSYVYLLKARFEEGIGLDIRIGEQYYSSLIPPFTLQLLVENCIKHNVVSLQRPLKIAIYSVDGFILVENKVQPKKTPESSTGMGLENIDQRYTHLWGKHIEIVPGDELFTAKLPVVYEDRDHRG